MTDTKKDGEPRSPFEKDKGNETGTQPSNPSHTSPANPTSQPPKPDHPTEPER